MTSPAWTSLDAILKELGCKVRWSRADRICFSIQDGACHWTYDGIELCLFGFRAPEAPFSVTALRAETAKAEMAIAEARRRGGKVDRMPPEPARPKPQPVIVPTQRDDDPFSHVDD